MKTYAPKPRDIERRWYVIDASDAVLGRLASEVASILKGKHKPIYAPHADTGDHVIVINASRIRVTGGKETKKIVYRHSGYPGGLREDSYERLLAERPVFVVERAVKGMLPHNKLGRAMVKKLQVYPGAEHPHAAQQPVSLMLGEAPRWDGLPSSRPAGEVEAGGSQRVTTKPESEDETPKPSSVDKPAGKAATTTSKRTTAKKTTAKKTTARKSPTKKTTAKKSTTARTRATKKT